MNDTLLRALVDLRDRTLQKNRIAFGNRMSAIERGVDIPSNGTVHILERWNERFEMMEKELDKDIASIAKTYPIIERMVKVKGIGPMLAAKVVSMIDITLSDTVSQLWRYAGYGLKDGERDRPTKGETLPYNKRLKTTLFLVASAFLKANSPYRRVYDDAREYYAVNRTDWTKGHQHNAAMRKMIKIWLSHLYVVWREMEGLPVRPPYVHEKLGHTHYEDPKDFGW